jgi:thiamine biosynthesis lipoprotein
MQKIEFHAMGCAMHALLDRDDADAAQVLAQVPHWFEKWEQCLSRFRETSELVALNRQAGKPVRVSDTLWQVTRLALQAAAQSDGLITPMILDALEAAGYDHSFSDETALPSLVAPAISVPRSVHIAEWRQVELDERRHTIQLPRGARLDLAGVAKGWAAEQAARRLGRVAPALVNASGDIAVSGPRADGTCWAVGIENPFGSDDDLPLLLISHHAVTTSSRGYRRWQRGGVEQHHLIDPRTGIPAQTDVYAATVVAPNMLLAEMAAKLALMLGSGAGMEWIEARPNLAALQVLENGIVRSSRRMPSFIWRGNEFNHNHIS